MSSGGTAPLAPGESGRLGTLEVLVLAGGPDAEREVSLLSGAGVADALRANPVLSVNFQVIDLLNAQSLRALSGDVIFPVLHGGWGEGGPLQDLLEADGRPFVGCGPRAARAAMDKVYTKSLAVRHGIPASESALLNVADPRCPVDPPCVVKPVHEGSSVGLYICHDRDQWNAALDSIAAERSGGVHRMYMVERYIKGRELTVGILDGSALPIIEIRPAQGVYDYQAKYTRDDTGYEIAPKLPPGMTATIQGYAARIATLLGVRHLCRVDFLLDGSANPWLLEVNTLPGFTSHSLLPMAAAHVGLPMPALCRRLVDLALRDAKRR